MTSINVSTRILSGLLLVACSNLFAQESNDPQIKNSNTNTSAMQTILIDKFIVPSDAEEEFNSRLNTNLDFIRTLPGLVEATAFEQTGGEGEFNYVTTAVWENDEAFKSAKETVREKYQKEGFDPQEMFKRLNIKMGRASYKKKIAVPGTAEKNKEIVRRLYEDCLNTRNFELLDEFVAEEYEGIRDETGPSGFEESVQSIIRAFPDIQWTIEDLIAEGDRVTIRWSWQGIHTGIFRGFLTPTQNHVTDHAIAIYQFRNNKIIKAWIQTDRLGFLQQTGVIPEDLRKLSDDQ